MIGSQTPRVRICPEYVRSDGQDAIDLMAAYASRLDPWQELVVSDWLGVGSSGEYVVTEAGLTVPRQNGKNVCIEARELFGLTILSDRILHTAHQVVTAKKSFNRLARIFTSTKNPELLRLLKNIRRTNGEEAIELTTGGIIEFSARSREKARGFDNISLLVLDEAQELTDDQIEAMMPILQASSDNRQTIYTGTPPYPSCPGTVFKRMRKDALNAPGEGVAWHEWGIVADSIKDIDVTNPALWYQANPSMGIHMTEKQTRVEQRRMSPEGFAREQLNWWIPELTQKITYAIPKADWDACASKSLKPEGKTAYGIKISAGSLDVALCGAVIPETGPARISLIAYRPLADGLRWLVEWLNARYTQACCVTVDGKGEAALLIDGIRQTWRHKDSVILAKTSTVTASAAMLLDAVRAREITWPEQQKNLRESAITATKRPISGGWGFGGEASAPIEAAALALWGARTCKRDPRKKTMII